MTRNTQDSMTGPEERLWAEIAAELHLQPFDVRRWFESQRTRYGKLSKLQSGQAPREMTKRQSWVYQLMGFLKTHIRRKGANRSSGFEASLNTSKQDESRGSTTDTEHLESSVLRERSHSIISSTPVSTDSKILEHFEQMRTLISGFLQQKSDRQPFFDYVASEAEKMTQEEFEELKGKIFRDIETIKSNRRRQQLPRRSATITTESQRVGLLPPTTQQASSSTQAAAGSSFVYYTPSPIGFSNPTSVLTVQDEGSRHNLSGILSQLPDLTSTQIVEQPQPQQPQQQLFTITTSALPQQQQQPPQ